MRAPVPAGRPRAAATALLISVVASTAFGPAEAEARKPPEGLERFRDAVGSVESGGDYQARNASSGAFGKYQIIMPANWPSWARSYLDDPRAAWSPRNQDRVAAAKMTALYRWLGSWERVAYWWLTGSTKTRGWSSYARRYVDKVMTQYRNSTPAPARPVATKPAPSRIVVVDDRSASIRFAGGWRSARHVGYRGDTVRYAEARGATASLAFTGRSVSWHGPTGPTRGVAKVYIDGRLARTVDLRRSSFRARSTLFRASWATPGRHTIAIVVAGSTGRSMVAIDDLTIRT